MIAASSAPAQTLVGGQSERLNLSSANYGKLPLSFEANQGQADDDVKFVSRGKGYSLFLTDTQAILSLSKNRPAISGSPVSPPDVVRMQLKNASAGTRIFGRNQLDGTANYFIGNDPAKWHTHISTFAQVKYSGVFPDIDLVYYGNQRQLEFDFILAPAADTRDIKLHFAGAKRLRLDATKDLIVETKHGKVTFHKPVIYQEENGARYPVAGDFELLGRNTIGFKVGAYDRTKSLVIDPVLAYSTYLGGSGDDGAAGIAVDSAGSAYVAGWTVDHDFPTTAGVFQTTQKGTALGGPSNAFVSKLNKTGTALVYSTYVGGTTADQATGIALDTAGNAYLTGWTLSHDFPVTPGAFQTVNRVQNPANFLLATAFVTKLNSTGTALVYSTYLGGSALDSQSFKTEGEDRASAIAIDSAGNAYVTGFTYSSDFPTTPGAFQTANSGAGAQTSISFVSKLNSTATKLLYSTYLGGSEQGTGLGIAVDSSGDAYVAGESTARDFPTTAGVLEPVNNAVAGITGVVTKLNSTGTELVYSTYLGGNQRDSANAIAVDASGHAYVTGYTQSQDFPLSVDAFQLTLFGQNAFVTKLNTAGSAVEYSTYLGGTITGAGARGGIDAGNAIAIDPSGNAYVAGSTLSLDFPVFAGALQTVNYAAIDTATLSSFISEVNIGGTNLLYSTFLAGNGDFGAEDPFTCDCVNGIALDSAGDVFVAGTNMSPDFPVTTVAFQKASGNPFKVISQVQTAFVTKFDVGEFKLFPLTQTSLSADINPQIRKMPVTLTATVQAAPGAQVPTGDVAFSSLNGFLGGASLDSAGHAILTLTDLPRGDNIITATYLGDTRSSPSSLNFFDEFIDPISTTTSITTSAGTVKYGTSITFTAHVSTTDNVGPPAGLVSFNLGNLSEAQIQVDSTGHATWTTSALDVGTFPVTAAYSGDTNYAESGGNVTETIQPLGVTPTATFSPAAGTYSSTQSVTISDSMANAKIYYTTNGSLPTTNTSQYSGTIAVNSTETIRAIAIAPGYSTSDVGSAAYAIDLPPPPPPDFSFSVLPGSLFVGKGQQGSTVVTVTPANGFSQPVTFVCSGLPAGVTCMFNPASITPAGAPITTSLSVAVSTSASGVHPAFLTMVPIFSFAAVLCCFSWRRRVVLRSSALLGVMAFSLMLLNACGGATSGGGSKQPPVTATVTVTATSGALRHASTLALTIE